MAIRLRLDPITSTGTLEGISLEDIAGMDEAIALINQRIEELELALQNQTNNAGRIEYVSVTGATQALTSNAGFIANNASARAVMTLPVTAMVGSVIDVVGVAAGGWQIAQNATQQIHFGNKVSTSGTGGTLSSTNAKDSVYLLCVTADTTWTVLRAVGNLEIV